MFGLTLQAHADQFQNPPPPGLLEFLQGGPKLVVPQIESRGLYSKCLAKMHALYDHKMSLCQHTQELVRNLNSSILSLTVRAPWLPNWVATVWSQKFTS